MVTSSATVKPHAATRTRLRTLLIVVHLFILILPLAGIAVLRLYESALIRQTESELIAQAAFVAAGYRSAFARLGAARGLTAERQSGYGRRPTTGDAPPARWRPRPPRLDLAADPILPPRPNPRPTAVGGDPLARAVGAELTPILREVQQVTLAGLRVVDYAGVIVASTGDDVGLSLSHLDEIQDALAGRSVSLLRRRELREPPPPLNSISRGGQIRAVVAEPILIDGRVAAAVLLARTPSNIIKALYGKRYLLLQFALLLLAVVVALTLFTSLTITRPLNALMSQARRAARGEKGAVAPLARPVTQEVDQLSRTLATMAQALEQRADYIRGFAAHVSHEFKTPLAAMSGALELLQDHYDSMSADERERFLGNLQRDVDRLDRLVKRLLELARADVMTASAPPAGTDVAELLRRAAADYERTGVDVELALTPVSATAAIDADTLRAVLDNLLENARQYAGPNPAVRLALRADDARNTLVLDLSDGGSGISDANAGRVFEPFFTTSRERGGTGLGLAIVAALLRAYGGSIRLRGEKTPGAHFELRLRRADV